jgi:hypothetical protein
VDPRAISPQGAKRSRSPGYPGIPLDVAIQRAKKLYDRESRNAAPIAVIVGHWGYTPGTSSSNVSVASLKRYGLLTDQGSGEKRLARLTDLALDILLNPDPDESIRAAALMPRIHRELYEKYGPSLPSDASLKHELVMTRGFTESGADDFIDEFRKTLVFAQLDKTPSVAAPEATSAGPVARDVTLDLIATEPTALPASSIPGSRTFPIPLPGGTSVAISGKFPISEDAWQQLLRVLDAMKPGLVAASSRAPED